MALTNSESRPSRIARVHPWLLAVLLFVFVLGANWSTTARYGSDMPDWDQYDAEGVNLFVPWFTHDHFVEHLFKPHNEHRVVVTKLQSLAVLYLAWQWDVRVQCLFNSLLHGFIAVGFWLVGRRWLASVWWQAAYYVFVALLYGLPLAWQNLVGGFDSAQYWLIGLSVAAMLLLPFARTGGGAWWAGVFAALLAMFTLGSGFFAALVVVILLGWRLLERTTTLRQTWVTLGLMTALIVIGLATRVEVAGHEVLKAKSAHDFILSILRSLSWPVFDHDWVAGLMWAPWTIVAVRAAWRLLPGSRSGRPTTRAELSVIALGGWVLIQLVATAYARGAGAQYPAPRYMDTLFVSAVANFISLVWLVLDFGGRFERVGARTNARVATGVLALAWGAAFVIGLRMRMELNLNRELPEVLQYYVEAEDHLRSFLATDDPAELIPQIPYPNAGGLRERLDHDFLRARMPGSVRAPLKLQAAPAQATTFAPNWATQRLLTRAPRNGLSPATPPLGARPTWGSYAANGTANTGTWRSAPLTAPLHGWLRFETAGDVGEPGVALELHDAATGARLATVVPTKVPHDTWRSAYVRAPRRPFVVVARDDDPQRWIAFGAPVELTSVAYWAWLLEKNGFLIAGSAALAALVVLASILLSARSAGEPQE